MFAVAAVAAVRVVVSKLIFDKSPHLCFAQFFRNKKFFSHPIRCSIHFAEAIAQNKI
jgi:hypothetical protein